MMTLGLSIVTHNLQQNPELSWQLSTTVSKFGWHSSYKNNCMVHDEDILNEGFQTEFREVTYYLVL